MKFNLRQKIFAYIRFFLFRLNGENLSVGKNVYIGKNCTITSIYKLTIGDNVYIGKNVTIEVEGRIGDGCLIGNNVGIVGKKDHNPNYQGQIFFAETVREHRGLSFYTNIGDGVWLGYGCIILSGVDIGDNAIIAAGAVVTKDVPEKCIAAGNPAQIVGRRP